MNFAGTWKGRRMAEFAFLFYPGDYLRDTQCLSEQAQVAYDRIMCEHMRNICITPQQLKFFTKKLSPEQVDELKMVLTEENGNFFILWVVQSINKRKGFVESRRSNRAGKTKNTSLSYDEHKEIVKEKEIVKGKRSRKKKAIDSAKPLVFPFPDNEDFMQAWEILMTQDKWVNKGYAALQASLNKLAKNTPADAIQMMLNTIAGEWQGLFDLKPNERSTKLSGADGKKSDLRSLVNELRKSDQGHSGAYDSRSG